MLKMMGKDVIRKGKRAVERVIGVTLLAFVITWNMQAAFAPSPCILAAWRSFHGADAMYRIK
jgi:hypothetical protein